MGSWDRGVRVEFEFGVLFLHHHTAHRATSQITRHTDSNSGKVVNDWVAGSSHEGMKPNSLLNPLMANFSCCSSRTAELVSKQHGEIITYGEINL